MTLFGLKWGQDLENLPAHQRAQFHILMTGTAQILLAPLIG